MNNLGNSMSNAIQKVTDATFQADVLASPLPVLVDYWAEWCGPCKMIAPMLDETATSYAGQLNVAKLNFERVLLISNLRLAILEFLFPSKEFCFDVFVINRHERYHAPNV